MPGSLRRTALLKLLVALFSLCFSVDAAFGWKPTLVTILSLTHRLHWKHFSPPHTAPAPGPALPPGYGPLSIAGHPSSSPSRVSKPSLRRPALASQPPSSGCCGPNMVERRGIHDCHCVYPVQVELLLSSVTQSLNWSDRFLEELAGQLDLQVREFEILNFYVVGTSRMNITIDIAPHKGISFSADQVYQMNDSFTFHKIHVDSALVGDYKLLNFTWFGPMKTTPAPTPTLSPMATPPSLSTSSKPSNDARDDSHSSLVIILGMCAGLLVIALASVLIMFSCTSRRRKKILVKQAAPTPTLSPMATPPSLSTSSKPSNDARDDSHSSLVIILGMCAGLLVIALASVLIMFSCTSRRRKKILVKQADHNAAKSRIADVVSVEGSLPHPTSTRFLAYEELKEATNNFEPGCLLGEGGFGRVFKGVLSDGTAVAIKKLTSGGHQGNKEFLVEVDMLSRLHHRNLVKLVGYFSSRDSSENLLCYELIPNGSLESWLHGPLGANCPLDWDTRMSIALDAARGLAYLHEDSQPCVIHRDFKASNILLEKNFQAKVSDFGLAKLAPEGRANYLSTRVMGTFGYVAPEYAMTGHLLVKSDVYSYGVVLLELLTGRRPVDMSQPSGQENLVTWARPILRDKDRLEELVDPRLAGKYPKDDFVRACTIAAASVAPEANQRPTMGEVVQSLKMVQRAADYQNTVSTPSARRNLRQSSTTYDSDGTSSMFSSGQFSGLFDNEHISRATVFSEDLHEGR